jgi:cytidyltransferase-like protein
MIIACCGTFDLFHEGHKHLLNSCLVNGTELHVFVIGENIVYQNKNRQPIHSLNVRVDNIKTYVPTAIIHLMDKTPDENMEMVLNLSPNIYCFGEDQTNNWNQELKVKLDNTCCKSIIVPRLPGISTTDIINKQLIK